MRPFALLVAVAMLLVACAAPESAPAPPTEKPSPTVPTQIVDLTHAFDKDTIYWPTDTQGFGFEVLADGHTEQGFYYAANRFSSAEHGGTHIDAPIHFAEGRATVDAIDLSRLVAAGVVVDVSERALADRDYEISIDDFSAWEAAHGQLPKGAIVLVHTGYSQYWGDRLGYLGTDKTGPEAVPDLHFPGLAPDAARWLVAEREIAAIGLDTPSIDYGQSKLFESHVALFEAEIPAFENVANLDQLPAKDFIVAALPMKISGGSGGPLRIVAWW